MIANLKKGQRLKYTHMKGSKPHRLKVKGFDVWGTHASNSHVLGSPIIAGLPYKVARCKVIGDDDWYEEVYLTEDDFEPDSNNFIRASQR